MGNNRGVSAFLAIAQPTNHLDVDARESLVQALNDYSGAVILISHDRHMVELTADRLVLVDGGTAREYAGSMEDYIDFVLDRNQPGKGANARPAKAGRKGSNKARKEARSINSEVAAVERSIARLQTQCSEIDEAIARPAESRPDLVGKTMNELLVQRAKVVSELETLEAEWLTLGEKLERTG